MSSAVTSRQRFAFDDPWFDPEEKFPEFMAELRIRYPQYSLVYDRFRQQWLVINRHKPDDYKAIVYVETAEGVAAEPDLRFLDTLSQTDVLRSYGGPKQYLEWLQREEQRRLENGYERMREDIRYAGRTVREWIDGGGREQIVLRPLKEEHRRQVEASLNASAAATAHMEQPT